MPGVPINQAVAERRFRSVKSAIARGLSDIKIACPGLPRDAVTYHQGEPKNGVSEFILASMSFDPVWGGDQIPEWPAGDCMVYTMTPGTLTYAEPPMIHCKACNAQMGRLVMWGGPHVCNACIEAGAVWAAKQAMAEAKGRAAMERLAAGNVDRGFVVAQAEAQAKPIPSDRGAMVWTCPCGGGARSRAFAADEKVPCPICGRLMAVLRIEDAGGPAVEVAQPDPRARILADMQAHGMASCSREHVAELFPAGNWSEWAKDNGFECAVGPYGDVVFGRANG